jgi:ribokinase
MPKIVNIGSLNIDEVFKVRDFVRPGETVSALGYAVNPGGKGCNQSIALARAGAEVYHAGKIGADGRFLKELLAASGADAGLVVESAVPSGRAFIQVRDDGQNCILLFSGANRAITEAEVDGALSGFSAGDWLLLQNETSANERAMREAVRKGMRIVLNPSPADASLEALPLELVDCFVLNEIEAEALAGTPVASGVEAMLDSLAMRFPRAELVLTLGSEGVAHREPGSAGGGRTLRLGARKVDVVDTTAAGDTFTGYYLASRARGEAAAAALARATDAAALCVTRSGAAPSIPNRAELAAFSSRFTG